jgi:hypothetical protein
MERRELLFRNDIKDGDEVIYERGKKYLITDEDDQYYYTGMFGERGIEKSLNYIDYIVWF